MKKNVLILSIFFLIGSAIDVHACSPGQSYSISICQDVYGTCMTGAKVRVGSQCTTIPYSCNNQGTWVEGQRTSEFVDNSDMQCPWDGVG